MTSAILIMALGAICLGAALGYASVRFKVKGDPLVEKIDAILPQTQCGQCSYPGCKPYAEAIAKGEADINQCPPGGDEGVRKLADLLGREYKPLSEEHGIEKPKQVAIIDEATCIGCTLCIQACPVDAIVGATRRMHTVLPDLRSRLRALPLAVIEPPDEIAIDVRGEPELGTPGLTVGPDGRIHRPLVGAVDVAGRTPNEAAAELRRRYGHDRVIASDIRMPPAGAQPAEGVFEFIDCTRQSQLRAVVQLKGQMQRPCG